MEPVKRCVHCKTWYPATTEYFYASSRAPSGIRSKCKKCTNIVCKDYREKKKVTETKEQRSARLAYALAYYGEHSEKLTEHGRQYRASLKLSTFRQYSKEIPECACCGENNIEFLSMDHVDGNGAEHRRNTGCGTGDVMYRWLRRHGYPAGFQVLCFNCNQAKGRLGQCPHQSKK